MSAPDGHVIQARAGLSERDLAARGGVMLRRSTRPAHEVRLSVVVPSYNTADFVGATVRSILRQTMASLEVIVVDDGSTDDSVERVLALDDPRITCVRQANRGLSGARNTGILLARGAQIGFCDSDDLWHPEKAERHCAMMDADPSIGLTFSLSEYLTEEGRGTGQLLVSVCVEPTARALAARNHIGNGSTPIVRAQCFEQAGLFDEQLNACADMEMWFRIAALTPWRLRRIPEVLTGYRMRTGSMSVTYDYFLADARRVADRMAQLVPELPRAIVRRGYAEAVRIASRKAFAAGNVALSRQLLIQAIQEYPLLPLTDVRALAMVMLHLLSAPLPERHARALYQGGHGAIRHIYAIAFGRRAGRGCGSVWTAAAA